MNGQFLSVCPICDAPLVQKTQIVKAEHKGEVYSYSQPGMWCEECGEGFLSKSDLNKSKKERSDQKRIIDNLLDADTIKKFRKTTHLSQKEAGEIFGGGPMAFSKYERGEVIQSRSTDILMRLILTKKISLEDVKEVEKCC